MNNAAAKPSKKQARSDVVSYVLRVVARLLSRQSKAIYGRNKVINGHKWPWTGGLKAALPVH